MNLDDVFGSNPNRPNHPDMWRLSEILLRMDSGMDPARHTEDELEAQFQATIKKIGIDSSVVSYAAIQRALRVIGMPALLADPTKARDAVQLSSAWLDGFVAGALWSTDGS